MGCSCREFSLLCKCRFQLCRRLFRWLVGDSFPVVGLVSLSWEWVFLSNHMWFTVCFFRTLVHLSCSILLLDVPCWSRVSSTLKRSASLFELELEFMGGSLLG